MTSRTTALALSDMSADKSAEAKQFLIGFRELFMHLVIHTQGCTATWKPVQCGVVISTTAALQLREYYICAKGFKYVLLSRFTQAALENLFSVIRFKSPVPRAREFKLALRIIILAQFFQPSKHASYEVDDSEQLSDFLATRNDIVVTSDHVLLSAPDDFELCNEEHDSLLYLSGFIARNVRRKNVLCEKCISVLEDYPVSGAQACIP